MNWNQIEGQWLQMSGHVKAQWAKFTDDDIKFVAGKRDQLVGKVQERYGILKDDAEKQVNDWLFKLSPTDTKGAAPSAKNEPPRGASAPKQKTPFDAKDTSKHS